MAAYSSAVKTGFAAAIEELDAFIYATGTFTTQTETLGPLTQTNGFSEL